MHGKRSDPKNNTLLHQGYNQLEKYFDAGKGQSKYEDKLHDRQHPAEPSIVAERIYSDNTLHSYRRCWKDFCDDLKGQGIKCKSLEDAVQHVPGYIERLAARPGQFGDAMSAWSIRLRFAGVGKVLGLSAADYDLPARNRQDICRSREPVAQDRHFSIEKNKDLIEFCGCCGLRNKKELQEVRGKDLTVIDGQYYIHVPQGKGGKERYVLIYGSDDQVQRVVSRMEAAGEGRVWEHVPKGADIHSYRAAYAQRLYKALERPLSEIPEEDKYYCRRDKSGVVYDRQAMLTVSQQLGHNRLSVIASHYLW